MLFLKNDAEKEKDLRIKKNKLFNKYSKMIDGINENTQSSRVVLRNLLNAHLKSKDTFFCFSSIHNDFCKKLIENLNSQETDEWINLLAEYLNENSINENLDLSELLNAFLKHYPEISQSITRLNNKCFSNYSMIHLTEEKSLVSNEAYRSIAQISYFFTQAKEPLKVWLDSKSTAKLGLTSKFLYEQFQDEMSINALLHWTMKAHLKMVNKILKKNFESALKEGHIEDLSGRIFKDFTGYQYALWAGDEPMQAIYENYLSEKNAKAQENGLKNNPEKYKQHGSYYDSTSLLLAMKNCLNDPSWKDLKKLNDEQLKLPACKVLDLCEVTHHDKKLAWQRNDIKNTEVNRDHENLWFRKWYKKMNVTVRGEYGPPACLDNLIDAGANCKKILEHDIKVFESYEAIRLKTPSRIFQPSQRFGRNEI